MSFVIKEYLGYKIDKEVREMACAPKGPVKKTETKKTVKKATKKK